MSSAVVPSKDKPPLPLGDILRDLALIRASDIDLQAVLIQGRDAPSSNAAGDVDVSLQQSYEFVKEARAALKIANRGDLERVGATLERVREGLDEVLVGLGASSQDSE